MQTSAPYAPYAPPQGPPPEKGDDGKGYERFKPKKKVNDIFFLIFFLLQFAGFIGVSAIVLIEYVRHDGLGGGLGDADSGRNGKTNGLPITLNRSTVYLLLVIAAFSLVVATLYIMLVRAFTKAIMHVTLILSILLNIGICIYYWCGYTSGAIVFTILAVFSVLSYWGFRSRIPFSALLLQIVVDISKHHKSVYVVAFISLIMQTALSVWFTFTLIATYAKWTPGSPSCKEQGGDTSCSSGIVAGVVFFEVFSYIWTSQVIGNVALATLAGGVYGGWYYFGPASAGVMPKNPSLGAFGRASTLSLGSIAFGSLIVTILEMIRLIFQMIQNNANQEGHPVEMICACIAQCIVGCIQSMVEYFNRYAYIEIALYGKPYIEAAKDTWRLFKDRGIDALVNDQLVSMTFTWGGFITGIMCSLFAYLYLRFTDPSYNADGNYTVPVVLFAFSIGLMATLTASSALEAGVSTIFVGLGEDPHILAQRSPALFEMVRQHYPDVVVSLHGP
ncbi:DUF580-domain-containing protein [Auriculariales sp. MPI-PUGE-AT-0066]|nr:DUF580-domain-containing protein [Auriculariales sp. MPI-PUGE-AT-0066]